MDASEREQYRAAIHGDREAFEMIIRTHSRILFAIAYGILQNREEAEDVVQDALVKAWKTRWRVRDPEKFPPGSQPSLVIALATFFGNGAPSRYPQQLTRSLSQVPLLSRTACS
jgi:Sigma-70 region 2